MITGLDNCETYTDDAVIYSEQWGQDQKTISAFFFVDFVKLN